MALFYLIFAVIIVPVIIIGIIGLIAGVILLTAGLICRKKPEHQGKRFPKIFIVAGSILVCIPVLTVGIAAATGLLSTLRSDDSIPEHWRNTWTISENTAADEAKTPFIKELILNSSKDKIMNFYHKVFGLNYNLILILNYYVKVKVMKAAGEGDRDALGKCFAAELQNSPDFSKELDSFLEEFPAALSGCELDGSSTGSSGSYDYGHNVRTAGAKYECELNGEKYYISLDFCFENTDEPDKVGVTYFSVRNLEARALYIEEVNRDPESKRPTIECVIKSSEEINARLIDGIPYIWHPTSGKKLSEDEMRQLLSKTDSMDDLIRSIGEPNVSFKSYNSTGYDFYYELSSEESEAQYAHITAGSPKGEIYHAYLCTAEKEFYDEPLKPHKKTN